MQSIKNIVGKEFNTSKGVITVTEFNEFNATLFNKKVLRHKMRRIQGKKSTKCHYPVLMIKDLL